MRKKHNETKCVALLLIMVSALSLGFGGQALAQTLGPLLPNDLTLSTGEVVPDKAAVVFDGTRYLVVWAQYYDKSFYMGDIYGRFVNKNGEAEGDPFYICNRPKWQRSVSVGFNGTYFLVAWNENVDPDTGGDSIRGRLVDRNGTLLGSEILISSYNSQPDGATPEIASDGRDFLVVWEDQKNYSTNYRDAYGQRVSGTGSLMGGNFLIGPAPGHQFCPTVGFGGWKYLVVWTHSETPYVTTHYLYGAFVEPAGSVSPAFPICTSPGPKSALNGQGISFDGYNFLVVWTDRRSGSSEIYGTRVTPSGALLDGEADIGGIRISANGVGPRAVFDGTNWLVAWSGGSDIRGARVSSTGALLDPAGFLLTKSVSWKDLSALAFDGLAYLVAWLGGIGPFSIDAQLVGPVVSNRPPVANAGPDQSAHLGRQVVLNGGASSDPDGDSLNYSWSFASKPGGSNATLSNPTTVNPSFTPDVLGDYVVQLVVTDSHGLASAPATVKITTGNTTPLANAGSDQVIQVIGSTVSLNGSGSKDADGDPLTFQWTLVSQPTDSNAILKNPNTACPTFVADVHGTYRAQLVVKDPWIASTPVTVQVTFENVPPVAEAGPDLSITAIGTTVMLDGSKSSDANGDQLAYAWSWATKPADSNASFNLASSAQTTFKADVHGDYVAQLTVTDGFGGSATDTVTVSFSNLPPVAEAGPDQAIKQIGSTVTLNGSASTDPNGDALTYEWSLTTKPPDSNATLTAADTPTPSFVADKHGDYIAQLTVRDGFGGSATDTVTVSFSNLPPVAEAGPDQAIKQIGTVVTLDGSGSSDPNGDLLAYQWSLTKPDGSTAQLSNSAAPNPTFVADVHGAYVAQLTVLDGFGGTSSDTVTVSFTNILPVAEAGPNQAVALYGTTVNLDGSKSYDDNGDKLTYAWSLLTKPAGSVAQLSDTTTVTPTFVADMHGDYNIQLIVNDGFGGTATDTVTVSFDNLPPVADAGSGGTFGVGQRVTLDGSRSSDPNHDPLTFKWSIISRPAGSATAIVDPSAPVTSLMLDAKGGYQVQLVANDGVVNSAPQVISFTATLDSRTVISEIQNLQGTIRDELMGSVFKNDTMKNALINKLSSVATNIEAGKYQEALGQLQHDLLAKTDGCATTGQPDKNDWIKDPTAQDEVYNRLMTIIAEVKALLIQP